MEDSLEHYIQIVKNTKEGRKNEDSNKISKATLVTLQKRKECEVRAVKIVEFLIEGKLQPEIFLRCLKHLNQSYYQDVVEERAVTNLCGYSLCANQIPKMPRKRFFIDCKSNKVYDITDRKNYCSNFCYKASVHIKQQIDDSPLWLRKSEDSPEFNLLPITERGSPGEEVNQGIAKPPSTAQFTSITEFANVSLNELGEMEVKTPRGKNKRDKPKMETVKEVDEIVHQPVELNMAKCIMKNDDTVKVEKNPNKVEMSNSTNSVQITQFFENSTTINKANKLKSGSKKIHKIKNEKAKKEILDIMQKYVKEWITIETYIFLHGEDKVKGAVKDKIQFQEYFKSLKEKEATEIQQRKYIEICRRLRLAQVADEKFDREITAKHKLKPVPNYKKLKEESSHMDLKVRSFYSGVGYTLEGNNREVDKKEKNKTDEVVLDDNNKTEEAFQDNSNKTENIPVVLPLVDNISKSVLRRKIYLSSVNKAVINITQQLGISSHYISEEIRSLVKTFKLEAHNVVLKPSVLNLTAVILLKMLSLRDCSLKTQLETEKSKILIKISLSSVPDAETFLCELLKRLEDVELFMEELFSNDSLN